MSTHTKTSPWMLAIAFAITPLAAGCSGGDGDDKDGPKGACVDGYHGTYVDENWCYNGSDESSEENCAGTWYDGVSCEEAGYPYECNDGLWEDSSGDC